MLQGAKRLPGSRGRELRLGIGDDCAILQPRQGEEIVVTTDFTLEGRHFRRDWHPPASVGHRALARGLSDLAAMGARPVAAFLSLALPRALDALWVDGFLDGLLRLAERARVPLAGGDTAEAPGEQVLIDIVLLGAVPAGRALRRDGAHVGDRLFCTGALGGAAAELAALASQTGLAAQAGSAAQAWAATHAEADGRHPQLYPEPRLGVGEHLLKRRLASAAMDLSDGLSTDLRHLCEASGVAAEVDAARLPLHPLCGIGTGSGMYGTGTGAIETTLDLALNGGEDYELLFTVPEAVRLPRRIGGVPLTEIGRMVKACSGEPLVTVIDADGRRTELPAAGWEHLR